MRIRDYAKFVGFDVCGKLRYMGKRNLTTRWFMDEGQNAYLIDEVIHTIRIKPKKKKSVEYTTDLI